ncbi:hypothetical protein [Stakelama saccharophila]|uniref:PepSY domain-containing protein n=1 Tax=Stakelama saccharophila TaxID=3075605 RepID=A0ABZ0BC56_9SPHN|nr:hypothetical protein [Stakelama sp. W311]WNO54782.1 hypothetical protein RPR59_05925 [Stakelama sp. W311]
MKRYMVLAAAAAVMVGGCQQQEAADQPIETGNMTGGPDNSANIAQEVAELPDPARNAVMIRAILDAGMNCEEVTKSVRDEQGNWEATCSDGATHVIAIQPDGTAKVISPVRK